MGYGLDGEGSIPSRARDFSLPQSTQTGSGSHPASYPMGLSTGVKRQEREADYSPPPTAEVKNGGAIPPFCHRSSWHSA
jgi:hypothetical protein